MPKPLIRLLLALSLLFIHCNRLLILGGEIWRLKGVTIKVINSILPVFKFWRQSSQAICVTKQKRNVKTNVRTFSELRCVHRKQAVHLPRSRYYNMMPGRDAHQGKEPCLPRQSVTIKPTSANNPIKDGSPTRPDSLVFLNRTACIFKTMEQRITVERNACAAHVNIVSLNMWEYPWRGSDADAAPGQHYDSPPAPRRKSRTHAESGGAG